MKTDISEKKPASRLKSGEATATAGKPAKESVKKSAGKRAEFPAKKPARKFAGHSAGKSAGNPAEDSMGHPAEKYTGKPAGKPVEEKTHAGEPTAEASAAKTPVTSRSGSRAMARPAAKKPASRLKSGEATATADKPAAKSAWKFAEGKPHASKPIAANSAAKKPKANPAEQKPIATTGRTVPADETAFLKTLGLAARARQTVMGTDMVCDALAEGRVRLVVEAGDTSENTHKRLTDKCITYRTPHVRLLSDGGTLGAALGKSGALAVCGVTGEIAKSLFSAWERLTASAPAVPEKVAKAKK